MIEKIINFFKEPPAKPVTMSEEEVKKTYSHFRWRIFYSSFIAYVVFHICRKNIAVALPAMGADLHLSNTELGILGSTLYVTYGIGKFINGVLADKSNVRTFLPTALILSAICNICFVISSTIITPGHVTFFGLPSAAVLLWIMAFFLGGKRLVSILRISACCKKFIILVFKFGTWHKVVIMVNLSPNWGIRCRNDFRYCY